MKWGSSSSSFSFFSSEVAEVNESLISRLFHLACYSAVLTKKRDKSHFKGKNRSENTPKHLVTRLFIVVVPGRSVIMTSLSLVNDVTCSCPRQEWRKGT